MNAAKMRCLFIVLFAFVVACAEATSSVDLEEVLAQIKENQLTARQAVKKALPHSGWRGLDQNRFMKSKFGTTFLASFDLAYEPVINAIQHRLAQKAAANGNETKLKQIQEERSDAELVRLEMGSALEKSEIHTTDCMHMMVKINDRDETLYKNMIGADNLMGSLQESYINIYLKVAL